MVGDLIDFLERNVDGFESGYDDDEALSRLLARGEFDEVASEMDETDVLVSSLETKLNAVENDLIQARADRGVAAKFSERLDIDERIAELKARDGVVRGYLKRGKKRLIRLRERYKELMVQGRGGRGYGGGTAGAGSGGADSTGGGIPRPGGRSGSARSPPPAAPAASTPPTSAPPAPPSSPPSSSAKSWRDEGFAGSYERSRSGGRRGSRGRGQGRGAGADDDGSTGADRPSTNAGQRPSRQQQRRTDEGANGSGGGATTTIGTDKLTPPLEPWVPPHRRTQSSAERDTQVKKRLRELKVDDDFEKLKREMGM